MSPRPSRLRVRTARPGDAPALAPRLRPADLRELRAATGGLPEPVLAFGIRHSEPCYAVVDDADRPVALFGAIPDAAEPAAKAQIWLMGAPELTGNAAQFLRHCRFWIQRLHERYSCLWNYIDARNEVHLRWLGWCGFTLGECIERFGTEGRPFYYFESRAPGGRPACAPDPNS